MAEAVLELASRVDGLAVRLLAGGGVDPPPAARLPTTLLEQGRADLAGPDGAPLTVPALTPERVLALLALPDGAQAIGRYLHALAFPDPLAAAWRGLRDGYVAAGRGLTTLLELRPAEAGAADLRHLPWELLCDVANGDLRFLFRDQQHPMGLKIPAPPAAPVRPCWPLRMLVLVGTTDDPRIGWEAELLAIRRALADFSLRIELKVVLAPLSKAAASQAIARVQPHLLHFIGHGYAPADGNGEGELWLSDTDGTVRWTRAEIRQALTALRVPPRIVLINACAGAAGAGGSGAAAIAAAFAQVDCPAVLAMRGDIPGGAAACFAAAFYGGLAASGVDRPDLAYARALEAVANEKTNGVRVWPLVRLFFQRPVAEVFPGLGDGRGFHCLAADFTDLAPLKPFVDRDEERARLYDAEAGWLGAARPASRVLLLEGDARMGKSWLLKSLVFVARLRGLRTLFWDFRESPPDQDADPGGQGYYELEDVLRALRRGRPWPGVFFARPPWYEATAPAAAPDAGAGIGPLSEPFAELDALLDAPVGPGPRGDEDTKSPKVQAFVRGLVAVARQAGDQPLFVALDHLSAIVPEAWNRYLRRDLVLPVARAQLGADIRLVIAGTPDELRACQLDNLQPSPAVTRLQPFPGERCEELIFEFLLHFLGDGGDQRAAEFRTFARAYAPLVGHAGWMPGTLGDLARNLNLSAGAGP